MAEGHAVARWAIELRALEGQTIHRLQVPARWRPRASELAGRRFRRVDTRGKHLLIHAGDSLVIHCHAMQYGSWQVGPLGMTLRKDSRYVRLHLVADTHEAAYFHGPVMEILTLEELASHAALAALGPDILADPFDRTEARQRLIRSGDRPIGDAILDQRIAAGVGNIYKSEGLFLAGLDPRRPSCAIPGERIERLWDVLIPLMRAGIASHGRTTTVTADLRERGEHNWVYRRRGRPCFRCGTPVEMLRQGELARATYFCPSCQQ